MICASNSTQKCEMYRNRLNELLESYVLISIMHKITFYHILICILTIFALDMYRLLTSHILNRLQYLLSKSRDLAGTCFTHWLKVSVVTSTGRVLLQFGYMPHTNVTPINPSFKRINDYGKVDGNWVLIRLNSLHYKWGQR